MPQEFFRLARLFTALAGLTVLAACGGGGGGSIDTGNPGGNPPGGNPTPGGPRITVSGRVTFDRLQFQPVLGQGLNAATPVRSPAREVVVQAVSNGSTLTSTTTDANGNYTLSVPANTRMFMRARSQMVKTGTAPTWTFTVKDNTQSDAVYTLDGASFNSGSTNQTQDLHAPSGWSGSGYTGERAAAPFAILDTVYGTKQLILGAAPAAEFPELDLFWSEDNRTASDPFCPDNGDIGTSFYVSGSGTDDCTDPGQPLPEGIYILGEYADGNGDTDEYDAHVIAHEFGHYFEDQFSRSDSIGGEHGIADRLDMRVAFGEGWGNAFGAMSLNDPVYRDSSRGISQDGGFNLETGNALAPQGWFSETSVGKILWDIFDTAAEAGDNVTLGFAPIYNVMTGPQVETNALTSIFSFAAALRDANGSASGSIENLLNAEDINGDDEFGAGETNDGGDPGFVNVYTDIAAGTPVPGICSTNGTRGGNKLGNRRFLRFTKATQGLVTIQATGAVSPSVPGSGAAVDPDILVHLQGIPQDFGQNAQGEPIGQSSVNGQETIVQVPLAAGTYVIEVYAFETINPSPTPSRPLVTSPRCMNVSIQAN